MNHNSVILITIQIKINWAIQNTINKCKDSQVLFDKISTQYEGLKNRTCGQINDLTYMIPGLTKLVIYTA